MPFIFKLFITKIGLEPFLPGANFCPGADRVQTGAGRADGGFHHFHVVLGSKLSAANGIFRKMRLNPLQDFQPQTAFFSKCG